MPDLSELKALLRETGISLTGPIVSSFDDSRDLYIFVKMTLDKDGRQIPSAYKLNRLRKSAAARDYTLHFILVSEEKSHIDRSLKTMLFGRFPDDIRNSFAAVDNRAVDIWIEPKRILSKEKETALKDAVGEFVGILTLECRSIKITQAEHIPTPTAILRTLRLHAPASLADLSTSLGQQDFSVPNQIWLSHSLDKLRKAGLVVRKQDGEYMLSLHALSILGTRKGRQSPDIERALALGRKR